MNAAVAPTSAPQRSVFREGEQAAFEADVPTQAPAYWAKPSCRDCLGRGTITSVFPKNNRVEAVCGCAWRRFLRYRDDWLRRFRARPPQPAAQPEAAAAPTPATSPVSSNQETTQDANAPSTHERRDAPPSFDPIHDSSRKGGQRVGQADPDDSRKRSERKSDR